MNEHIDQDRDIVSGNGSPQTPKQRIKWFLAFYFLLLAGIMTRFLMPLPEQKPVIEFSGFAVVLFSVLFAILVLRSRSRWLLLSLFPAIPTIVWTILQKNRYLAMALEKSSLLSLLPWSLLFVALILLFPSTYRYFSDTSWHKPAYLKFFKNGFPW